MVDIIEAIVNERQVFYYQGLNKYQTFLLFLYQNYQPENLVTLQLSYS